MLDDADLARISQSVQRAEGQTSGEIVVVLDRVAQHFMGLSVLLGLLAGLLTPWPLIALTQMSAQRIFIYQLVLTAGCVLLFLWLGRNGRLVPGFIRRRAAHQVALREFNTRVLNRTGERTGILFYIALAEHYAEIIPDSGISPHIGTAEWRGMIEKITGALSNGRLADGVVGAIEETGRLLAANFPPSPADRDELPNRIIVI